MTLKERVRDLTLTPDSLSDGLNRDMLWVAQNIVKHFEEKTIVPADFVEALVLLLCCAIEERAKEARENDDN